MVPARSTYRLTPGSLLLSLPTVPGTTVPDALPEKQLAPQVSDRPAPPGLADRIGHVSVVARADGDEGCRPCISGILVGPGADSPALPQTEW